MNPIAAKLDSSENTKQTIQNKITNRNSTVDPASKKPNLAEKG